MEAPRYDTELGRYVWDQTPRVSESPLQIEPAFIKQTVEAEFDPPRHDVTTFADTYPHGTTGAIPVAEITPADGENSTEFDPLADWRLPGDVADNILVSLPEGTPRMLRTLLTLLLGGMRGGSTDSKHR